MKKHHGWSGRLPPVPEGEMVFAVGMDERGQKVAAVRFRPLAGIEEDGCVTIALTGGEWFKFFAHVLGTLRQAEAVNLPGAGELQ
jgi:hypothetical protein